MLWMSSGKYNGVIQLIIGPMFSGKSSELIRKIKRYDVASKKCILVNKANQSQKNQNYMTTHDKIIHKSMHTDNLSNTMKDLLEYDVIAIDQAHFFHDIAQVCEQLANQDKIVIVAALDATFERKPFFNVVELLPISEFVTKLSAVCVYCYKQAAFTLKTIDFNAEDTQQNCPYKPVCRACYNLKNDKNTKN